MGAMAFTLAFDSPASADEVLAAIREATREWRESAMPRELRSLGYVTVYSRFRGRRFTLGYESTLPERFPVELVGTVAPSGVGSRVTATCGRPSWWIGPAVFAAFGVLVMLSGGTGGAVAFLAGVILGLILWSRHARVTWDSGPEGRCLAERLERAMATTVPAGGLSRGGQGARE